MVPISDLMQNGTVDWQRAKINSNGCAMIARTKRWKAEQTTTTSTFTIYIIKTFNIVGLQQT